MQNYDKQKLFHRVASKISIDDSGCWVWGGSRDNYGYGRISSRHGEAPFKVHRVMFYLINGTIDDCLVVRHLCDNPPCCNPSHLVGGSQKDNARDTALRGRLNPKSALNLRPGHRGFHGAGPISRKEIECHQ